MRKSPLAVLIVTAPLIAAVLGFLWTREGDDVRPFDIPATDPIRIALAGDVLLTGQIEAAPEFVRVGDIVRGADFAAANLEMNLLGTEEALRADARPAPRWPYGSALDAGTLRRIGFDVVSLANDHAGDYGPEGTTSTMRIVDAAGLLRAGTGRDLVEARRAVLAGPGPRRSSDRSGPQPPSTSAGRAWRVAFLSVAASSFPDARATLARADIAGRPGSSPLRYTPDITVDATTFQTLKESLAAMNAEPGPATNQGPRAQASAEERELIMFGTPIRKGDRTTVEFLVDENDLRAVVDEIRAAKAAADVVVVSVHSHEPANASDEPAEFIRRFAHAAIDAGASIVVGHGPHRLRGIEVYKGGAILYSLGNFLYQTAGLDFRAANMFDAGADLYQAAVGAMSTRPESGALPPDDPAWWEGVVAEVTFDHGQVIEVRLHPLDLDAGTSREGKGVPRLAEGERAASILARVAGLTASAGGRVQVEGGVGVVRVARIGDEAP